MVLVTTALEETFPKDKNKKILFLGEWCKLYSRKGIYKQYDYETLLYHWDDREKLYQDTQYIDTVYEKYLKLLKENLNEIHNVSYTLSYWRIILGPWLRYFIEIVYDRYLSILEASKKNIDYVNILNFNDESIVSHNMEDFTKLCMGDIWNQFIYQNIINYFNINQKIVISDIYIKENLVRKNTLKIYIKKFLFYINKFNSIHFFSSNINNKDRMLLQCNLKQIPMPIDSSLDIEIVANYSKSLRDMLQFSSNSLFEKILVNLIKKQIPIYYLEGYSMFRQKVLNIYPNKADIIFTADSFEINDTFKFWSAEKKEQGANYIIGQHGGNYGMGLFASHEEHQIKSSDKFFSWGWSFENNKVIPVSAIKLNKKIKFNKKGNILVPLMSTSRYSFHIMAMPIAGQILNYFDDQVKFLNLVSNNVKKILKLRIYQHDYDWNMKKRLVDSGFQHLIDTEENLSKSFHERLSECRLCICTYNATTYLETFSANYPTLLFWNPLHWELRDDVKPYFDILIKAGILHYSEDSLVKKIDQIYKNPSEWWNQDNIQNAKNIFCNKFANFEADFLLDYKKNLKVVPTIIGGSYVAE